MRDTATLRPWQVSAGGIAGLVLSIGLTVWVARALSKSGRVFLIDTFLGNRELADSVNHLLVVGFYLVNLGWIIKTLRTYQYLDTVRAAIELLSDKFGTVLLLLGVMHFFNLYLFSRFRRRALNRLSVTPPIAPSSLFAPREESI